MTVRTSASAPAPTTRARFNRLRISADYRRHPSRRHSRFLGMRRFVDAVSVRPRAVVACSMVFGTSMAERKSKGGGAAAKRGKRSKPDVIDVGDKPAEGEAEKDSDADEEAQENEEGLDTDLAAGAAGTIDVGEEPAAEGEELDAAVEAAAAKSSSLAKRDPMAAYMRETRRYPLLTPEEEKALAVRLVEHGDTAAARRLIEANLRLVVKIAYEYRRAHKNLLDLVQEGNIGLIQAVSKFDPYRGVKLSSYAAFWIRAYILKFILNNWRLVKIGTTQAQRKLFFNLRKEREKLEQLGYQPTTALLAEKLDVAEKEVIEMERRLAAPEASLDAPLGGGRSE